MIKRINDLPPNIYGIEAIGKVTDEDYQNTIIPEVENLAKNYDNIRFMYVIGEQFEGYSPVAMLDDAKLGFKNISRWEKVAVVTDKDWIRTGIKMFIPLFSFKMKVFELDQLQAAIEWIVE